jgi:hypothetical protein
MLWNGGNYPPASAPVRKSPATEKPSSTTVIIPTFRRPEWCAALLRQLVEEQKFVPLIVHVHDDASGDGYDYSAAKSIVEANGWYWKTQPVNNGLKNFWRLSGEMLRVAREEKSEWFLRLDDDFDLCDQFLERLFAAWNRIPSESAAGLIFFADSRFLCGKRVNGVVESSWIDDFGFFPRRALDAINWKIFPVEPQKNCSNVGLQISMRLTEAGHTLWCTESSLVDHRGAVSSVMLPDVRPLEPLHARDFVRKTK